ncbi:hypothetical protein VXD82_01985 [Mycobacteroides chelonae]|uniref:hypothetical protein n=1 Tax=Mycobacteroides chelonae TaxID=1774 RepID=UPI003204C2CB
MAELLSPADLAPFAEIAEDKAKAMIDDVLALAGLAAPCLDDDDLDPKKALAVKAILRGAVLRWNEAGQGGLTQVSETVGPWQHSESFDNSTPRRSLLWPSEISKLQEICGGDGSDRKAWSYDTAGGGVCPQHGDTCAINLGASFCDCGAIYSGAGPLWGTGQ